MKSNALVITGFSAAIALGLVVGYGCTSGDSVGGQGGSTGNGQGGATGTGQGGATGSQGGATGSLGGATGSQGGATGSLGGATGSTGGASGGLGGATGGLPLCSPAPDNGTACNSNPSCTKNCGINASAIVKPRAQKACTCSGAAGVWACPSNFGACVYPTSDWSCFHLPTPLPACPGDPAQPTGLIRTGLTACTPAAGGCGNVCGSAAAGVFSYQDSTTGKVGYCACVGTVYQCASVNEWAPQ